MLDTSKIENSFCALSADYFAPLLLSKIVATVLTLTKSTLRQIKHCQNKLGSQ